MEYWVWVVVLAGARGADFWSTWLVTPDLSREANPIVRWLGWKRAVVVNVVLCLGLGFVPVMAAVVGTCSVLIAAENLVSCQLSVVSCQLIRMGLILVVGGALIAGVSRDVVAGIGGGILAYGVSGALFGWLTRRRRGNLTAKIAKIAKGDGMGVINKIAEEEAVLKES